MTHRLVARKVSKRFPGVQALDRVDLEVGPGEVVAVVGENGAGKSTLMKILAGIELPDSGALEVEGRGVKPGSVSAAQAAGIALIHQELYLCDRFDLTANVCLGRESRRFGLLDAAANRRRARRALERVGLMIDEATMLSELSIGHRQMVEIAKAIEASARILIMDEPTSSLSHRESERLFDLVEELTASGTSVIYISHRLQEVERLADRAMVLRDGRTSGVLSRAEISHHRLVDLMVGREIARVRSKAHDAPGKSDPAALAQPLLRVRGLRTLANPGQAIDLDVHAGEIVGLAGLVGAGRSELLRALFQIDRATAGTVSIDGASIPLDSPSPARALRAGLALVPEDRKEEGLFLSESVRRNLSIARLAHDARNGFVDRSAELRLAERAIRETRIKTADDGEVVAQLSGGNQQKVLLGRAFATHPKVLFLDEPTRGVDVGAKGEIYALLDVHLKSGGGVLFASSEMEEILGLCDRCLVLHEGRLAGVLQRHELSEDSVMQLATGAVKPCLEAGTECHGAAEPGQGSGAEA